MCDFRHREDLSAIVNGLYDDFDFDENGNVSIEEMYCGFLRVIEIKHSRDMKGRDAMDPHGLLPRPRPPSEVFRREDFRLFLEEVGFDQLEEFDRQSFQTLLETQLRGYMHHLVSTDLKFHTLTENDRKPSLAALKLLLFNTEIEEKSDHKQAEDFIQRLERIERKLDELAGRATTPQNDDAAETKRKQLPPVRLPVRRPGSWRGALGQPDGEGEGEAGGAQNGNDATVGELRSRRRDRPGEARGKAEGADEAGGERARRRRRQERRPLCRVPVAPPDGEAVPHDVPAQAERHRATMDAAGPRNQA